MRRAMAIGILAAAALAVAAPAAATKWCGQNGVVRFAFGDAEPGGAVLAVEPDEHGLVQVEVHAWLTDFEPVAIDEEAFLSIGAYEFALELSGTEALATGVTLPEGSVNLAQEKDTYLVGMHGGARIEDGRLWLGSWKLLFRERPADVRIALAPEGGYSCATIEGCAGTGNAALFVGTMDSGQINEAFGAPCEPAWINPTAEPDLAPVGRAPGWREVGRAEERRRRF